MFGWDTNSEPYLAATRAAGYTDCLNRRTRCRVAFLRRSIPLRSAPLCAL